MTKVLPDWMKKIVDQTNKAVNRQKKSRVLLARAKILLEEELSDINEKYGSQFSVSDIFSITSEEEDEAIDLLDKEDSR